MRKTIFFLLLLLSTLSALPLHAQNEKTLLTSFCLPTMISKNIR